MTKPFRIWIEDKKTFEKVTKQMDKDGIRWASGRCASHNIDLYNVPIALFVDSDNRLTWDEGERFKDHKYSEITPEEYLKEDKTMIKVGDIVRVTNWVHQYSSNDVWFKTHIDDLETDWLIKYAHGDSTHYMNHQYNDMNKYQVLYVDEYEAKCLIASKTHSNRVDRVYLIGLKGVELYDKPTEMTISEIEEKLGIKNLKIVKEDKNND